MDTSGKAPAAEPLPSGGAPRSSTVVSTDRGKTVIADEVISVIARIAAEQVQGVHQIGDSSLRGVFARLGRHAGVASEVGLKEAAVDISIIVEYGVPIADIAAEIRRQVIENVEYMTGRRVIEVNINVVDVYIPKSEQAPALPAKRQIE